mmetsp:Transcript_29976/g.77647  ORF Transcript_29976/g.77647 Transcript_29976/m.77647 type:complete len:363 (-) Transcript_29976:96-1184(-)
MLFNSHAANVALYENVHHDSEVVLHKHENNQMARVRDYTPEERLQSVEMALQKALDREETLAVEAYERSKRESRVIAVPKRPKSSYVASALIIQKRFRLWRWYNLYIMARSTLIEQKMVFQRVEPAGSKPRPISKRATEAALAKGDAKDAQLAVLMQVIEAGESKAESQRVDDFQHARRAMNQTFTPKLAHNEMDHSAMLLQHAWRVSRALRRAKGPSSRIFTPKRRPVARQPSASSPSIGSRQASKLSSLYVVPPSKEEVAARKAAKMVTQSAELAEDLFAEAASAYSEDGDELVVDQGGALLNLCVRLLQQTPRARSIDPAKVGESLARWRGSGCAERLDFDTFIELYNDAILPLIHTRH